MPSLVVCSCVEDKLFLKMTHISFMDCMHSNQLLFEPIFLNQLRALREKEGKDDGTCARRELYFSETCSRTLLTCQIFDNI
jgi:hypothetical protein